jgi:hypothetical protein
MAVRVQVRQTGEVGCAVWLAVATAPLGGRAGGFRGREALRRESMRWRA